MSNTGNGPLARNFKRVSPTPEEVRAYRDANCGHNPSTYRNACKHCGARIWGSGFAVASHLKTHPGVS